MLLDTAAPLTEKWKKKVAALEEEVGGMKLAASAAQQASVSKEIELRQTIVNLSTEREMAVQSEVGKLMMEHAESRAAAFRDGMAYAKELFKEMRAIA